MNYNINKTLKEYIEKNIFPEYEKNDYGHRIDHIEYVIRRSLKFAEEVDNINFDMVYTIAAYHDIGHNINPKEHERISGEILYADEKLKEFFTVEEINVMKEAIEDHRASKNEEPRSIYGKIVSSADRNTDLLNPLIRTYAYRKNLYPEDKLEIIIEESKKHLIEKFGSKGYATEKMYFEDFEYKKFLEDINELLKDDKLFREKYLKANNLN